MLALAEIIIERIRDAQEVKKMQKVCESTEEGESASSKKMSQMLLQIERRENSRLKEEMASLENLSSLSFTSEQTFREFMSASMAVFRTHSPHFQQISNANQLPNMRVHRLYREFLLKNANTLHFAHICSYLRREICQLNAVIYLGWLGEWSRGLLSQTIKKWGSSSQSLRLRTELSRMVRDKLGEQKSKESGQLFLHSRQNFYSYFLSQLEEYYRKLEILDLDCNYLRSIKRYGRKEDLIGKNANESINFIISKNNTRTLALIRKYTDQYEIYSQKKSRRRLRVTSDSQNSPVIRLSTLKSFVSRKLMKQENLENTETLQKIKRSRKSKMLLGEPCQRIEFPLIQTVNNNKCLLSSQKTKKSLRRIFRTQPEQQKESLFIKNQPNIRSFFKKPEISFIVSKEMPEGNALFEYNSIETQFQHRRQSIIKKIQQKGIDLSSKGSKISFPTSACFDDHVLKKARQQRLFLSQKSK